MNFAISWILGLFRKPSLEVTFDKMELNPWPFPAVEEKKRKPRVQKATTRKPAVKKPVAKKATKVAKKKTK